MIGWMINPTRKRRKKPKSSAWSKLVNKYGVTEAAKRYKKKSTSKSRRKNPSAGKGGKKMAKKKTARRRKHLTPAHRAKIGRGVKRALGRKKRTRKAVKRSARIVKKATKRRRHRKNPITRKKRRAVAKRASRKRSTGKKGYKSYRYSKRSGRYLSNPLKGLKNILPSKPQLIEAGQVAAGAVLTTAAEPYVVRAIGFVYEKVKGMPMPMGFLPSIALVPINIVTAGVLGVGANTVLKKKELAGRVMAGGLVVAIINLVRSVREYANMGQFGVIVPEETMIDGMGQYESDLEVEGLGMYEPETTALDSEYIQEYQTPQLGEAAFTRRKTIERFSPYFKG